MSSAQDVVNKRYEILSDELKEQYDTIYNRFAGEFVSFKAQRKFKQTWSSRLNYIDFSVFNYLSFMHSFSYLNRVNMVVDSMMHACLALWPHTRYYPGHDSLFLTLPLSYLPTSLRDYIYYVLTPQYWIEWPKKARKALW